MTQSMGVRSASLEPHTKRFFIKKKACTEFVFFKKRGAVCVKV